MLARCGSNCITRANMSVIDMMLHRINPACLHCFVLQSDRVGSTMYENLQALDLAFYCKICPQMVLTGILYLALVLVPFIAAFLAPFSRDLWLVLLFGILFSAVFLVRGKAAFTCPAGVRAQTSKQRGADVLTIVAQCNFKAADQVVLAAEPPKNRK
eukprot:1075430-Pelagomonas_calceolata.AAC.3